MGKNLSSELIGFHQNADIVKDIKESEDILKSYMAVSFYEQTLAQNKDYDQNQTKNSE